MGVTELYFCPAIIIYKVIIGGIDRLGMLILGLVLNLQARMGSRTWTGADQRTNNRDLPQANVQVKEDSYGLLEFVVVLKTKPWAILANTKEISHIFIYFIYSYIFHELNACVLLKFLIPKYILWQNVVQEWDLRKVIRVKLVYHGICVLTGQ